MAITEEQIIDVLRECYDPEIPINIYDLGLVRSIDIEGDRLHIAMTLTAPGCPVAGTLGPEIQMRLLGIEGVNDADVEMVWDPPWTPDDMRPEAKELLASMM
ncbi:MAG: DUF59 domain-containing protein [Chloroflexi bacterium]|nr:DUF59 domain-containing protein [Chloroflexota bacterium]